MVSIQRQKKYQNGNGTHGRGTLATTALGSALKKLPACRRINETRRNETWRKQPVVEVEDGQGKNALVRASYHPSFHQFGTCRETFTLRIRKSLVSSRHSSLMAAGGVGRRIRGVPPPIVKRVRPLPVVVRFRGRRGWRGSR